MDCHGKCHLPRRIQILPESKESMKPLIKRWLGEAKRIRFTFTGEATIDGVGEGGWLYLDSTPADIYLETWYKRRTPGQLATLKAIESLLYWCNHKHYPVTSKMLDGYHEVILEMTGIYKTDPHSGKRIMVRTSHELCTTEDMNRFIDTAVALILEYDDLPSTMVEPLTGKNFIELYRAWYMERSVNPGTIDAISSWEEYLKIFPYDEFHVVKRQEAGTGRTQKIHIVSRGADKAAIEEPWNWIHGATSVHTRIHNNGWEGVLQEFPHIVPKVRRARELAKKKELI